MEKWRAWNLGDRLRGLELLSLTVWCWVSYLTSVGLSFSSVKWWQYWSQGVLMRVKELIHTQCWTHSAADLSALRLCYSIRRDTLSSFLCDWSSTVTACPWLPVMDLTCSRTTRRWQKGKPQRSQSGCRATSLQETVVGGSIGCVSLQGSRWKFTGPGLSLRSDVY